MMERIPAGPDPLCGGLLPVLPAVEKAPALQDETGGTWISREELRAMSIALAKIIARPEKGLVFLASENRAATVISILAAAAAGHAVMLVDPALPEEKLSGLIDAYRPDILLSSSPIAEAEGFARGFDSASAAYWAVRQQEERGNAPIAPNLQLMLATSGTTGSARFVRLSGAAIVTNALQIADVLRIDSRSVAIAHLPLHYSYGLSVVTSHLQVGGRVFVMNDAVTSPSFWQKVAGAECTHFPGVPFHYATLARFGFELVPASVTTFTQAGGALDTRIQERILENVRHRNGNFHVMYGQTEASPRMTTTPGGTLPEKLGSVGKPLAGGQIRILDDQGNALPAGDVGNVIYEGPNVMLGYASSRSDLALGDELAGVLATGDIGWLDADGFLFLKGRVKRFAKVSGLRIALDAVELDIGEVASVSCFDDDEKIVVCHESGDARAIKAFLRILAGRYRIPSTAFVLRHVSAIPRKENGKTDYARLREIGDV